MPLQVPCRRCNGTGLVDGNTCPVCNGTGLADPEGIHDAIQSYVMATHPKVVVAEGTLADILDKVNDIKEKCDEIMNKLNE